MAQSISSSLLPDDSLERLDAPPAVQFESKDELKEVRLVGVGNDPIRLTVAECLGRGRVQAVESFSAGDSVRHRVLANV